MLNRRDAFKLAAGSAAVGLIPAVAKPATVVAGFTLPPLPYAVDALEPHIDAKTMEIHHDRHHKTYVDNLNKALEGNAEWLGKTPTELVSQLINVPQAARLAVQNNGGGHWNHSLFWATLGKPGTGPKGDLEAALNGSFGGLDGFKKQFKDAALKRFGSGWAWLVPAAGKKLEVVSTPNQDNPLMTGGAAPILGIDVWEHAYYLKYQNKRADYVDAFFNVINWDAVAANFADAGKK